MYVMVNSTASVIPNVVVTRFKVMELYLKHLYFLLAVSPVFRLRTSACMHVQMFGTDHRLQ